MADFPAMPLWTDAFLSDTMHLDATETGAYMLLLMTAWRTQDTALPDNDLDLQRWARCSPAQWQRIKPRVMKFWTLEGGKYRQKKLDSVREDVRRRSKLQAQRSKARFAKPLKNNEPTTPVDKPGMSGGSSNQNQNQNQNQQTLFPPEGGERKRARRIPDGWMPDLDGQRKAKDALGENWQRELAKFRNYWEGLAGKGAVKVDWNATWRNWVLNAEDRGHGKATRNGAISIDDKFEDIRRQAHAQQDRYDHRPGEDDREVLPPD